MTTRNIYGVKQEHVYFEKTHALIAKQATEAATQKNLALEKIKLETEISSLERESNVRSMIEWSKKDVSKAQIATEQAKQKLFTHQSKVADAIAEKTKAETKILVEQSKEAAAQGHLYNAGTALACFGCVGAVMCLGVWSYKIVQELRGN